MRMVTERYEFAHGRKPKGKGLWFLEMTGTDGNGRYTTFEGCGNGSLAEVKKRVAHEFKISVGGVKRIIECVVLP